jgi:protein O-GlcNAc transferase
MPPRVKLLIMKIEKAAELRRAGKRTEAEAECRRLLRNGHRTAECLNLLATLLHETGRTAEALEPMQQAVAMSPRIPEPRINLAAMLGSLGRLEEGLDQLFEAVKLRGDIPELHNNLGVTLENLGRLTEAESSYRTAAAMRPEYIDAHSNLGNALRKQGKLDPAIASYRQAIALRNVFPAAHVGLAEAMAQQGNVEEAIACRRRIIQMAPNIPALHSDLLYTLLYSSRLTPADLLKEAKEWAHRHGTARSLPPHQIDRTPGRRLRIGYLSPDFRAHTIAHLIEPILESHDRKRFEVFCYSSVQRPDAVTGRLKGLADQWRDVSRVSDDEAAAMIRRDRIDILVELAGHMGGNRLLVLARRPAPVQVQLGYAGTTGLPSVDYRITDPHSDPPGAEAYYSEKLVRLPDCAWPYKPSADSPEVGPLPALSAGHVTFGCLNKPVKITDEAAALWGRILAAVPGSKLMVLSAADNGGLLEKFERKGIPPDRLELSPPRPRAQYLDLFNRIDIALDPFPYNGDTTTCDGLWMGVPLVTLAGNAFVSRRGVCYLAGVGLSELVAGSSEKYVAKAVELAGNLQHLSGIRATLRERMQQSPLTNGSKYTAGLEAALGEMWRAVV